MLNRTRDDSQLLSEQEVNGEKIVSECLYLVQSMFQSIKEARQMAQDICINKTSFLMMAFHLSEITPILDHLVKNLESVKLHLVKPLLQRLGKMLKDVCNFMLSCSSRSRIFLLYKSNAIVDEINSYFNQLSLCIGAILAAADLPIKPKSTMQAIQLKFMSLRILQEAGYNVLSTEISSCLDDAQCSEATATSLLQKIAEFLHVPEFQAAELKQELQHDLEKVEADGLSITESLRALNELFSKAEVLNESRRLASQDSHSLPISISSIPSSFFCPITKSLMREPVMIAEEGFTYEKSAIVEWFDRGHSTCPDTGKALQNLTLVPNLKLQQAMDEFFDHMYQAQMVYVLQALRHRNEKMTVQQAVCGVKRLTDLGSKYRQLFFSLDGVEVLIDVLKLCDPDTREIIFKILIDVCTAGDAQKAAIVECGAVHLLVGFLQKNPSVKSSALQLLCELSKISSGKSAIALEKGAMFSIATAYKSSPESRRLPMRALLDNLCKDDIYMILEAAKSMLLEPLVSSLISENDFTKFELLSAVLESFELDEYNSVALVNAGIVPPLLNLVQEGSSESMHAAVKLLSQLSSVEQNKLPLAKAGAIRALVKYLVHSSDEMKVDVTAVLSNLATDGENACEIDSEGAVARLFMMIKLKDCLLQEYSLKTLGSMARDSATVRSQVRELGMVPFFYSFLESNELSEESRKSVLTILRHVTKDSDNIMAAAPSAAGLKHLIVQLEGNSIEAKETVFAILEALGQAEELALVMISFEKLLIACALNLNDSSSLIKQSAASLLAKFARLGIKRMGVKVTFSKYEVFSGLLRLLDDIASTKLAKQHAAEAVYWLSSYAHNFTAPSSTAFGGLARLGIKRFHICPVHEGKCSVKETFCIVEAGAIPSLINLIKVKDLQTSGWAVKSLSTLTGVSYNNHKGIHLIMDKGVLAPLLKLVGDEANSTTESLELLEKILRVRKYRGPRYANAAKTVLMQTMAMGDAEVQRLSATALMHLGMMSTESSYANAIFM